MKQEKWIDAYQAAKKMDCKVHNVWAMIRRLSLKSKKIDGKLYTCDQWIEEFLENKRNKDFHSIFNGRKVFDPDKGELSLSMVAKELNLAKRTLFYYIHSGKLKSHRKGHYIVVLRENLEQFKVAQWGDKYDIKSKNA